MDSSKSKNGWLLLGDDGKYVRRNRSYIPNSQYQTEEHQNKVVEDIADKDKD